MDYIRLGKTNLLASRTAFGAMKIEKIGTQDDVAELVRKAYDSGINFFDTSHLALESEKLLGQSLYAIRQNVIVSTKTTAQSDKIIISEIEDALSALQMDFIDLFQYDESAIKKNSDSSNPTQIKDEIFESLKKAKQEGKIKHIGLVTEDLDSAIDAATSEKWECVQFPFNALTDKESEKVVRLCDENDVGFIAMQPLAGGLIRKAKHAFGFLCQYENVVPVWGVQNKDELFEILFLNKNPPAIDEKFFAEIEMLREFFN